MRAGQLREKMRFESRISSEDGLGNKRSSWVDEFTVAAAVLTLRGGETVMASRLQGKAPAVITIWASNQARRITTDWRCVDARSGTVYNIRTVQPSPKRDMIEFLVDSGGASG